MTISEKVSFSLGFAKLYLIMSSDAFIIKLSCLSFLLPKLATTVFFFKMCENQNCSNQANFASVAVFCQKGKSRRRVSNFAPQCHHHRCHLIRKQQWYVGQFRFPNQLYNKCIKTPAANSYIISVPDVQRIICTTHIN